MHPHTHSTHVLWCLQIVWIGFDGAGVNTLVTAAMALGSPQLLKQCNAFHMLRRQVLPKFYAERERERERERALLGRMHVRIHLRRHMIRKDTHSHHRPISRHSSSPTALRTRHLTCPPTQACSRHTQRHPIHHTSTPPTRVTPGQKCPETYRPSLLPIIGGLAMCVLWILCTRHALTCSRPRTHKRTSTRTRARARTRTRTHTHTRARTHAQRHVLIRKIAA